MNSLMSKDLVKPESVEFLKKEAKKKKEESKDQLVSTEPDKTVEKKTYVPGIVRCEMRFPRPSSLNSEQHAMCVKILKHFSSSGRPDMSTITKNELTAYLNLQNDISKEQEEFLKLAKEEWDSSDIKIDREDLINLKWKSKVEYALNLHRYYMEVGTIPFVSDQNIKYNFDSTVLDPDSLPIFELPDITRFRYNFFLKSEKIEKKYFTPSELRVKNQISEDPMCLKFAESHDVDIVISSSGLKCLGSNIDPSFSQIWILPIEVKEINNRNVIFIDKPLPPQAKNALQKNFWIYNYIIKTFLIKNQKSFKLSKNLDNYVDLDKANDLETNDEINDTNIIRVENNYQYNIFTLGACGSTQNELMKNKIQKDYKMLVRSKIDAVEKLENGEMAWIKLVPKLENQLSLGAEAVTLEEAAKQWISLAFTPDTSLVRLRIHQKTSELIQYERRSPISINNELVRLYNVRGEDILPLLYNITETMIKMTPGKYLLRHTIRSGAFVTIYKAVDTNDKNTMDLQTIYCDEEFRTIPNSPWPSIDKTLLTPALICFNRMPATFYPSKLPAKRTNNKKTTKAGKKKAMKNNSETST
ncbi:uncharacterized protein [Chelonus insularis]|uniref:uncharacterized protein isoform X2 n=1 Tax=Chelonus insularis TaxID=460826 RepID=UPI0015899905|nr:uncharacterized protein LOC118074709 isoform X2 [Chelonus insularis]